MGVVPACQGHTALHFPNLRGLLTPDTCAAEAAAAGGAAQSARCSVQSPPGPPPGGVWGTPDPCQLSLRTEPHWPPQRKNNRGAFPGPLQPPTPLSVVPKAKTRQFQAACPAISEAVTSAGVEECEGCHVNPPPPPPNVRPLQSASAAVEGLPPGTIPLISPPPSWPRLPSGRFQK